MVNIKGSTALVTGGQRGLGKAFVRELLDRGATKVYATARNPKPSDDPRIVPVALDVTDAASVAALAELAGDVSIVINNAGVGGSGPLLGTRHRRDPRPSSRPTCSAPSGSRRPSHRSWRATAGERWWTSTRRLSWIAGAGAYGASKAAFWSATNSLRLELAPQGTLVVGVHLGYADTDLTAAVTAPKLDPRDVARAVVDGIERGAPRCSSTTSAGISSRPSRDRWRACRWPRRSRLTDRRRQPVDRGVACRGRTSHYADGRGLTDRGQRPAGPSGSCRRGGPGGHHQQAPGRPVGRASGPADPAGGGRCSGSAGCGSCGRWPADWRCTRRSPRPPCGGPPSSGSRCSASPWTAAAGGPGWASGLSSGWPSTCRC